MAQTLWLKRWFPCKYFFAKQSMLVRLYEMLPLLLLSNFKKTRKVSNVIIKRWNSQSSVQSSLLYCIDLVKRLDYENYLCTLLLPHNMKASAFAIRAFNIEISRIQEHVTEAQIMPIRFKFWEERLDDIYNDRTVNHPVVIELSNAVKRHKLSKMFLKRLLSSRSKLVNRSTFNDMNEMVLYADQSNSPVYMLLLEAYGVKNVNSDHLASHLGIAQGITNLVRALPFNLKERLILMPMTTLSKHHVSEESMLRMSAGSKLNDIVLEVAGVAAKHLDIAQSLQEKIPEDQRSIFLPAVAVRDFLNRLEKCDFDVFASVSNFRKAFLPISLMWHKLWKVY